MTKNHWKDTAIVTLDCAATIAGLLIATPFALILAAPFILFC